MESGPKHRRRAVDGPLRAKPGAKNKLKISARFQGVEER